ncbi:MAG: ATP-binding protein [Bacteroidales bacterium]|nr:ATP-binding protein [Bacteroidales bacterium]
MQSITIQSDTENLPQVEALLSHFCDQSRIDNYYATISVAVMQAVENAIVHGNLSQPDKQVTVCADYCPGGVCFVVSDQGQGFDHTRYTDLPQADNPGTGLFIMRSLADRVVFADGGRTVRLEFFILGIDSTRARSRSAVLQRFYATKMVDA